MKKHLIITLLLIISTIGCSQNLKIKWTPNPANNRIELYEVYTWEGDSSQIVTFDDSLFVLRDSVAYKLNATIYEYNYHFDENSVIRAAVIAVDSLTRRADFSRTEFYGLPAQPNVVLVKE